ncbi:MAG: trifunctional dihydropteroate synthetase [Vezdaea aestivalis]|nr:MAG: trifunctional dihydropteroate synthetase [Vezdaea aestivalis]
MYVLEQNRFLNGVCEVETDLSPHKLLNELKAIEKHLGRQKIVDKGPRNIDLDVLLYDSRVLDDSPTLSVPHKFMLEREFVLRPLCDLIPTAVPPLPDSQLSTSKGKTYQGYLSQLPVSSVPLSSLTPIPPSITLSASSPSRTTHVMGIINVTPDSFSDGGLHSVENLSFIAKTASDFTSQGATILDVGGQSTRPGATPISAEEELARVIPVIQTLRKLPSAANISLSIDTYRASVARVALDAGADMINDVTGGRGDSNMLGTAATRHVPIILTHSRGTPETMSQLATYPEGMIETVGRELAERVKEAERAGVRRWHIILDPGLGFAKGQKQNLELLRDFDRLRSTPALRGLPWLVGPSRKGFIGRITGVEEPSRRGWGTAATITAAVQGGADIVRVHDVKEMVQVAKMADAIWRC